ncbi:uncharacterized protein LOC134221501 [Armigeres subalbatus]|uniref:uncharacterized protein LOC134221501 n=1 Tax=Armigeres subalbatus TaxID=124917 RepID=UPI002ED4A88A
MVPGEISSQFIERQVAFRRRNEAQSERKIEDKVQALFNAFNQNNNREEPTLNEKAILNATTTEIPAEVEHLLSLGSKFSLPYHNLSEVPMYHLIADVESIIKTSNDVAVQERTRCAVANQIQNYLHRMKVGISNAPTTKFYCNAEKRTRVFLNAHPEIIVVNSDKGNRTVIMEREDYKNKMNVLLQDSKTYRRVKRDLTCKFQNQNNSIVKRLQDLHLLDPYLASKLKTYKAVCPKIYGQPKAHKPGLPLRPVVPCMTAPAYELSKFVSKILQSSMTSKYNVRDSFSFCEYVNSIELPEGCILVSFDVVALFTSIPKSLVRQSIFRHWDEITHNTSICLDLFWEIMEFCIDASYFVFEGEFYQQIFGTAMGNPLSPIIAEYVMEDLLDNATTATNVEITHLKKYVDDLFLVLPSDKIQEVLGIFNQQNTHIQFTVEIEENNRLPFLDMLLIRQEDRTIKTEWYKKPIASA